MANFKTHLLGGVASAVASTYLFWNQGTQTTFLYITGASIIGSLFPDIDSDTSKTIRYFFSGLTILSLLLVANSLYLNSVDIKKSAFILISIPVIILYIIKLLFTKMTSHRGIYHTIPMGLTISLLLIYLPFTTYKFIISVAFMLGFLSHLLLDEIYSSITITGLRIKPKKSFGTALKWFAPSLSANITLNIILALLIFKNYDFLYKNITNLF
jgi:membrane-bound metal-dependent hydrolase YbcI (DUF457 family)